MEWLTAVTTLLGVLLGWWLTNNAGEGKWLREARLDRYAKLLHSLDKLDAAFDDFMASLASPGAFSSQDEWHAATDERAQVFGKEMEKAKWAAAEVSLFASRTVSARAADFFEAVSYTLRAFESQEESSPQGQGNGDAGSDDQSFSQAQHETSALKGEQAASNT